jgi:hypothetical protein
MQVTCLILLFYLAKELKNRLLRRIVHTLFVCNK